MPDVMKAGHEEQLITGKVKHLQPVEIRGTSLVVGSLYLVNFYNEVSLCRLFGCHLAELP